jgi:hypothetical protein
MEDCIIKLKESLEGLVREGLVLPDLNDLEADNASDAVIEVENKILEQVLS